MQLSGLDASFCFSVRLCSGVFRIQRFLTFTKGIHAILYFISTYLLLYALFCFFAPSGIYQFVSYKGIRLVRARFLLLVLTSAMFLASIGVIIIDMIMVLRQAQTYGLNAPTSKELNLQLRLASNVLMRVNVSPYYPHGTRDP